MTDFDSDIPAPGEPLKTEVHPHNQALLDEELQRRLELANSKLSRLQQVRLRWEYNRLHRTLNRAGYNKLILKRAELLEEFQRQCAVYRAKPNDRLKKRIIEIQQAGKDIDAKLAAITPTLTEFEDVKKRLEAHEKALQLELEEKENRKAFFSEADTWEQQILSVFRQSPRLHHVVRDEKGREKTIIPKIDHVLLKADKIYFRIKTSRQGWVQRWTGLWTSALPYGVDVPDLTSEVTLANLTVACGRVVTIERSPRSQNLYYVISRMDSADGIPKNVRFDQVTEFYPTEKHTATPWAAGLAEERKVIHYDFEQHPHVLIAGSSGGGKSNLINMMLAQLVTMNSPDELRLLLIDNKGGVELSHFDGVPHLLTPPVITVENVLPALKLIRQIMTQRFEMMLKVQARNLLKYNERVKNPIPRIIVVVDEMASLLGIDETPDIHNELRVITSQGRATGVHMVVSTQHPSVDVLPGWIKTNLTLRIASRMPNHTASQIVVDSITAAHLPEVPGRMVFRRGGFEQILQTPKIEDEGIARAVKIAQHFPAATWQLHPVEPHKSEDDTDEFSPVVMIEEPEPKFTVEDYLKTALQIGGRLSPARIHQIVGNEIMPLRDLRVMGKKIVEQKQVMINGIHYKIKKVSGNTHVLEEVEQSVEFEPDIDHDPEDIYSTV